MDNVDVTKYFDFDLLKNQVALMDAKNWSSDSLKIEYHTAILALCRVKNPTPNKVLPLLKKLASFNSLIVKTTTLPEYEIRISGKIIGGFSSLEVNLKPVSQKSFDITKKDIKYIMKQKEEMKYFDSMFIEVIIKTKSVFNLIPINITFMNSNELRDFATQLVLAFSFIQIEDTNKCL